jgi:hypothetical protein
LLTVCELTANHAMNVTCYLKMRNWFHGLIVLNKVVFCASNSFNFPKYADILVIFIVCRYHEACDKAREKVLELLRELSAELQNNINVLVFASNILIISKALFSHVR